MQSIPDQIIELQTLLTEEADQLAHHTFLIRERRLSGSALAHVLIFGLLQEPSITLDGLCQILGRRKIRLSASGLNQRFTAETATFFRLLVERLVCLGLSNETQVQAPILQQFSSVRVEDSTSLYLPNELASVGLGCGGPPGASQAGFKLMVQWDLLCGQVHGPSFHAGRCHDLKAAVDVEQLPDTSLYLADLAFWHLERYAQLASDGEHPRRFFLTRYKQGTSLLTRENEPIDLKDLLPKQEGKVIEQEVLLGQRICLPVRLIAQRVPPEVAERRRERIRQEAQDHGKALSEESLHLAQWTILICNVPASRLSAEQILMLEHLRWQIECLFSDWKRNARLNRSRSHKPWRILCEIYAKLCGLIIQQWLMAQGCWQDACRSQIKASQVVRREAGHLMYGLRDGRLAEAVQDLVDCMQSGCRGSTRKSWPSMGQYLLGTPVDERPRSRSPGNYRRSKRSEWPAGKGWDHD